VIVGLTVNGIPVPDVPNIVPPDSAVHHLIIPPLNTALKSVLIPHVIGD